jgi:TonB family protein
VVLRVRVLTDGMLANVQLERTSQHPRLDDAALEIVGKKLKVSAAVRQGQPVTVERQVNVTFKITHPAGEPAPSTASAQPTGSVGGAVCTSFLLMLAHEMVLHCGDPPDASAEQRYDETLLALKTFIVENIPSLKGHTDPRTMYSKNEQRTHEDISAMDQSVCEKPDYAVTKRMLETVTSVEYLAKLRESMKTWSTDTNAIGCL